MSTTGIVKNKIRDASKVPQINTSQAITKIALRDADAEWMNVPVPNLQGELKGLLIGGFGQPEVPYGAGHTRPLTHATYAARQIITLSDIDLMNVLGIQSNEFKKFMTFENKYFLEHKNEQNFRQISKSTNIANNVISIMSGAVGKDNNKMYLNALISNIKKDGLSYVGDVSLYSSKNLGHGRAYMDISDLEITNNTPIKTLEILHANSGNGQRFKQATINAYKNMHEFYEFMNGISKEKDPSKTKILTVWNS